MAKRKMLEPKTETEVTEVKEPITVKGVVVDCTSLNIRKEATVESDSVGTLDKDTEVDVNLDESTEDFYAVPNGFCMRKYIKLVY